MMRWMTRKVKFVLESRESENWELVPRVGMSSRIGGTPLAIQTQQDRSLLIRIFLTIHSLPYIFIHSA
jgi:hypothetical protein